MPIDPKPFNFNIINDTEFYPIGDEWVFMFIRWKQGFLFPYGVEFFDFTKNITVELTTIKDYIRTREMILNKEAIRIVEVQLIKIKHSFKPAY